MDNIPDGEPYLVAYPTASGWVGRIPGVNVLFFVLFFLSLFLIVMVLIPFYGSGMNLMSISHIYQTNNCCNLASWYPLWADEEPARIVALYTDVGFNLIGLPLFIAAVLMVRTWWRKKAWYIRLLRLLIIVLAAGATVLDFLSGAGIGAWLLD